MNRRTIITHILIIFFSFAAFGSSYFDEGEKAYLANDPNEALPLLKEALAMDPTNPLIYQYLGTVYEQLGDYEKSCEHLKKGLNYASGNKVKFYYNLGNNYFMRQQMILAEEMYTKAIIEDSRFADPYLNRANSRMQLQQYGSALTDYRKYLQLNPTTSQRPQIEAVISALTDLQAEEERLRREQQEKDQNLKDLLDKLQNASGNIKNLSAGSATPEETYEEDDILD